MTAALHWFASVAADLWLQAKYAAVLAQLHLWRLDGYAPGGGMGDGWL